LKSGCISRCFICLSGFSCYCIVVVVKLVFVRNVCVIWITNTWHYCFVVDFWMDGWVSVCMWYVCVPMCVWGGGVCLFVRVCVCLFSPSLITCHITQECTNAREIERMSKNASFFFIFFFFSISPFRLSVRLSVCPLCDTRAGRFKSFRDEKRKRNNQLRLTVLLQQKK